MKCCSLTLVKDMTYLHLMNRCIFWPIMRQLNTSIEAVVCSGAFVPMSKCARMLVLFLGIFLVINSQTNFISSQDFFDLDDKNNQKMNTSSRSTPVITDFSILSPQLGDGISPSTRAWFSVDDRFTFI